MFWWIKSNSVFIKLISIIIFKANIFKQNGYKCAKTSYFILLKKDKEIKTDGTIHKITY